MNFEKYQVKFYKREARLVASNGSGYWRTRENKKSLKLL
jgi:hypothetical protein